MNVMPPNSYGDAAFASLQAATIRSLYAASLLVPMICQLFTRALSVP